MAAYRVLDIETIPDPSAFTPNAPKWSLAPGPSENMVRIASGEVIGFHGGTPGFPAYVVTGEAFPPPQAHRVVAISWVELSSADNEWYFVTGYRSECAFSGNPDEAEDRLLRMFAEAQSADKATLVSWNGRTFDLPVLNLRSFRRGIQWPWYYHERDIRYRYSENGHCDLMDVMTDYGAARALKLGDAARLIGLPGKTGPISGASVAAEIGACQGKSPEEIATVGRDIARYCLSDSVQTAVLYVRQRYHAGILNAREHDAAIRSFENIHFNGFEDFDWSRLLVNRTK